MGFFVVLSRLTLCRVAFIENTSFKSYGVIPLALASIDMLVLQYGGPLDMQLLSFMHLCRYIIL